MATIKRRTRVGRDPDWRARVYLPDGTRTARCFSTRAEASAWAAELEDSLRKGAFVAPARAKLTLAAWVNAYLPTAIDLRPSTRARDLSYIRNQILPHFGDWPLGKITRASVQVWVNELATRLAPATATKALHILSKILDGAIADGRLAVNPCRTVKAPKIEDEEARFLTPYELVALEDAMPASWRVLVPFLADVGLRIGEAAALRWRDVDTARLTVVVREVLVEVPKAVSGSTCGAILGPPKTRAGRRTIPMLTPETAARLTERRAGAGPDDFVFALSNGSPFRPNQFRARVWRPAVLAAELADPQPTPHALRHTAVAHWIEAGVVDQFKLKTWGGHRDASTIYRIYGHLLPTETGNYREAMSAIRATARAAAEAAAQEAQATSADVIQMADRRR